MRISEILKEKRSFSLEFFPPKLDQPMEPLMDTIDHLERFKPDFVSVTYGAGGTNKGRNNEVCINILERGITLMSHFTCIGNSREDVRERVTRYVNMGAENILALRGDLPEGWTGTGGYYTHGNDLIAAIAEHFPQLCIAGSCYPEKHIEAPDFASDIAFLKSKQDNGAEFFVTQLCFDMEAFERFLDMARKAGVTAPIVVGLMPVLNKNGVIKMTSSNGCAIPPELHTLIDKYGDDPDEFRKAGKEYTKDLIYRYLKTNIAGIHMYTLNKYKDISEIIDDTGIANA